MSKKAFQKHTATTESGTCVAVEKMVKGIQCTDNKLGLNMKTLAANCGVPLSTVEDYCADAAFRKMCKDKFYIGWSKDDMDINLFQSNLRKSGFIILHVAKNNKSSVRDIRTHVKVWIDSRSAKSQTDLLSPPKSQKRREKPRALLAI
jgi:hypothetical protein